MTDNCIFKVDLERRCMEAEFCVATLEDALARHDKPDIFNTDQGSQFTDAAFTGLLANKSSRVAHSLKHGMTIESSIF